MSLSSRHKPAGHRVVRSAAQPARDPAARRVRRAAHARHAGRRAQGQARPAHPLPPAAAARPTRLHTDTGQFALASIFLIGVNALTR